ncbi:MAG: S8 family serine peptidase [Lachnospiraceae bacterium]|nr:S8 family serine peptidase [Lachnospiraceae bacterium]
MVFTKLNNVRYMIKIAVMLILGLLLVFAGTKDIFADVYSAEEADRVLVLNSDASAATKDLDLVEYADDEVTVLQYESGKELEEAVITFEDEGIEVEKNEIFVIADDEASVYAEDISIDTYSSYKDVELSGNGPTIAVIDTGYDFSGGVFGDRVEEGVDFSGGEDVNDNNGHGTAIADMILQHTGESVKVLPVKVADASGRATLFNIYMAIDYCIERKVNVINMSMTAYKPIESDIINEAIKRAKDNNIAVIVAAGNNSSPVKDYSPGNCEYAVTVAACDENHNLCDYSNYGEEVDLMAAGSYGSMTGTSVSAAYVSVFYAQMLLMNSERTPDELYEFVKSGADVGNNNGTLENKVITTQGIESAFECGVCESAKLFTIDYRSVSNEYFDELIANTPEATIRRYLLNLSEEERADLMSRNTILGGENSGYTVIENVSEDSESGVLKEYNSYMDYLLQNEFETQWYCSSSTKTGYFYINYKDETTGKNYRQKISVKLKELPTAEGNKKAKVTVSDTQAPKNGSVGYTLNKAEITKGLETNYVYLGIKFKLNMGDVSHYRLTAEKDKDTIDEQNGGGGVISIDDKSKVECTGNKNVIDEVVFQISFHNMGISVTGQEADTKKHGSMTVRGEKCSSSWKYQKADSIENGKRVNICSGCNKAIETEYLNWIEQMKQKSDGSYTDDSDYLKKLNMDGSSFKDKKSSNYYAKGELIEGYTAKFDNSVYITSKLDTVKATSAPTGHILKVARKRYNVVYNGNGATSGSMAKDSFYFNQSKQLTENKYSRKYVVTLNANGGVFSDKKEVHTSNAAYTFSKWATSSTGSGVAYKNMEKVKNIILSGTDKAIGEIEDGKSINLYAYWSGGEISLPTDVTKMGYTLLGWAEKKDSQTGTKGKYKPLKNITLYAIWKPRVSKIIFDNCKSKDDMAEEGTKSVYQHYSVGYFSDSAVKKKIEKDIITIPGRASKETFKYKKAYEKSEYGIPVTETEIEIPLEREYIFEGYYTKKNGSGYEICDSKGKLRDNINNAGKYRYFESNTTVYASWKKENVVVFDNGLCDGDLMSESDVKLPDAISFEGDEIQIAYTEPEITDEIMKKVYRFKGWSTDLYGSDIVLDSKDKNVYSFNGKKDLVLYAVWEAPLGIKYHGNGSAGDDYVISNLSVFKDIEISGNDRLYLETMGLSDDNLFVKENYVFMGWRAVKRPEDIDKNISDVKVFIGGEVLHPRDLITEAYESGAIEYSDDCTYINLYAYWDAIPVLTTEDAWFSVEEGLNISEEYIFSNTVINAFDEEKISESNPEGRLEYPKNIRVLHLDVQTIKKYAAADEDFSVTIVIEATDDVKNTVTESVTLHFVSPGEELTYSKERVRFISSKYINTLDENSIWKEAAYKEILYDTLEKKGDAIYEFDFSKEQIADIKLYLSSEGNLKTEKKLIEFFERYLNTGQ